MADKKTLLIGEPMGLFVANSVGKIEDVNNFLLTTCGAELNVAIGMRRLEHDVSYMTKLGHDPFGKLIVNRMNEIGISTDMISYSETNTTGFMFKAMVETGDPDIFYFRKGSAASTLSPEDVERLDLKSIDIVHLTGITPAISESARNAVLAIAERAKKEGVTLSFDPNLRPQLWPSKEAMASFMNEMAYKADVFLPGINEIKTILGVEDPEEAAEHYLERGTGTVIIKLGAKGAYYAGADGKGYVPGFHIDRIVDTVGAGDGFAAGVLTGIREGLTIQEAVRRGCAIGAIQLTSKGDNDGLPTRPELADFMAGKKNWRIEAQKS